MVYAYDRAIPLPVKDLYDTLIMSIAIGAAKDMYDRGLKQIEDFYNKYGDFISPIQKDMDWYAKNVTGRIADVINQLYANGIDPLRSAEGRAVVAQLVNSMPVGDIAKLRLSADAAKEYIKNRGRLEAAGLYNPDLEERFLGFNLNNWDTIGNGAVWNRTSPIESKSLKDLTESSYNNRTPHDLTKDEVLSFAGQTYDPRMKYKGFTDADLLGIANTVAPGLTGTPWNDYFRDLAARKVAASGKELTDKNINDQLARDIANTQQEYLIRPIGDLDDWYKQQLLNISRERLSIARAKANNNPDAIGWTTRQREAIRENYNRNAKKYKNPTESQLYGLFQTNPLGADKVSALAFAANMSSPEQVIAGLNAKRLPVSFVGNDIFLTKKRQYLYYDSMFADPRKNKLGMAASGKLEGNIMRSHVNAFDRFLKEHHVSGYIPSQDVTVNYTVNGDVDVFDVNTHMRVNKSDLDPFFEGDKSGNKFIKYGEAIGLVAVTHDGRRIEVSGKNKQKLVWDNIESIDIPMTRSMETPAYGKSLLDVYHDAFTLGKGTGSKRQRGYEDRDEDDIEY